MFILIQAVSRLFLSFIPFMEIVFLSYVLGYSFGSFPLSMVIFLFLLLASYFHAGLVKALAWGLVGFVLFSVNIKGSFLSGLFFALIFGGLRYGIHLIRRRWKG